MLGGIAIAVMALVSSSKKTKAARGVQRAARILIHSINDDRCIGCDACVAVCPTNVLDLVSNKSRVVRFQDCIQCEACMWACPTEALVMHPEGSQPPTLTVPELDQHYQTAVQGQYLIGEVAGKPLIKNAANIGRGVVEHMLANGLRPSAGRRQAEGSDANNVSAVDVLIVGSGPGGLSTALTCMHRGLSYVVLDKEQLVASTIARYPKGKLVMAEPYDCQNNSLLPVFDSSKEQLVPLWEQLIDHLSLNVKLGEAVESIQRGSDGWFDVRTTVAAYRSQRVVIATGLRGKPRTLGVTGENLPVVHSLLEDPDEFAGQSVAVIGGGDSALEAAMALADAGAKVLLSYRGRGFSRAQAKNKQAIDSYAAQRRIKVKFQTQVAEFAEDSITLRFPDGTHKRYPNNNAFVLIGADPPVKWLEKMGVGFVQRPHQYQLGPTDAFVQQFIADVTPCPEDVPSCAARVLGQEVPHVAAAAPAPGPSQAAQLPRIIESGRKFIRSASEIFTSARKVERPMPLSEFAAQSRRHSGNGRRDALPAAERTRVLRMLGRDVGARLADEESQVYEMDPPSGLELGVNDKSPSPQPRWEASSPFARQPESAPLHLDDPGAAAPMHLDPNELALDAHHPKTRERPVAQRRPPSEMTPRQALIVGLAKVQKPQTQRRRRPSSGPRPPQRLPQFHDAATVQIDTSQAMPALLADSNPSSAYPVERHDEPTAYARPQSPPPAPPARRPRASLPPPPPPRRTSAVDDFEEATRAVDLDPNAIMAAVDRPNGRPVTSVSSVVIEDEDPTEFMSPDQFAYMQDQPRRPQVRSLADVDWDFDE